jgi:hypothetical protein
MYYPKEQALYFFLTYHLIKAMWKVLSFLFKKTACIADCYNYNINAENNPEQILADTWMHQLGRIGPPTFISYPYALSLATR